MVFVFGLSVSYAHTVYITHAVPRDWHWPVAFRLRDFILKTELIPVLYKLIDALAILLTEIEFDVEKGEN